jgi:hypothetical protein
MSDKSNLRIIQRDRLNIEPYSINEFEQIEAAKAAEEAERARLGMASQTQLDAEIATGGFQAYVEQIKRGDR